MTKKDYELIALAIARTYDGSYNETRHVIAIELAQALRGTNPRFNHERFMLACKVRP